MLLRGLFLFGGAETGDFAAYVFGIEGSRRLAGAFDFFGGGVKYLVFRFGIGLI